MCGLVGYIGKSKKPDLSFQIITKLFKKSEIRGIDASGFYAIEENSVLYYKEPIKSSKLVQESSWLNLSNYPTDLLLAHARGASRGSGDPSENKNNHPFVNSDKSIALIHNGLISNLEYNNLKYKYALNSECDSEILIRIFESFEDPLLGIKEIFSLISEGQMAVAIGQRIENDRFLYLFRNQYRPLWIVDMRELLGQVFFVSDPLIWEDSVVGNRKILRSQKLIELPEEEIWIFSYIDEKINLNKHKVVKEGKVLWEFDGNRIYSDSKEETSENSWKEIPIDLVCDEIVDILENIKQKSFKLNYTTEEYDQLLLDLDQQNQELKFIYDKM